MVIRKRSLIPNRRCRFQYSVRALLLVTLCFAILAAWYRREFEASRAELETIEWVQVQGGRVGYAFQDGFLGHILPRRVTSVEFVPETITHAPGYPIADIAPLINLKRLERIALWNTQIKDLDPIRNMPHLRTLIVATAPLEDITPLTDAQSLQILSLLDTQVDDISPLAGLGDLQILDLRNTNVYDLTPLRNIHTLRVLTLGGTQVESLQPLSNSTSLRILDLENTPTSDFRPLQGLLELSQLRISESQASAEQLRDLRKAVPNLDILCK